MTAWIRTGALVAVLAAAVAFAGGAAAEQSKPQEFPCGAGIVQNQPLIHRAAFRRADLTAGQVGLTFIGHATFVIESPEGVTVATDYNDFFRPLNPPDIATMNIQRANHSTVNLEPQIKFVLRGWDTGAGIPHHDVRVRDVRVYNVPVNIETFGDTATNFSSMFVIQAAGICIAHLGHLRHVLTDDQVRQLGRIDIALVPVDRVVTESYEELLSNLEQIKPRLIVPMHFAGFVWAEEFIASFKKFYPIKRYDGSSVAFSRATLPQEPEILLLKPSRGFRFGQPL